MPLVSVLDLLPSPQPLEGQTPLDLTRAVRDVSVTERNEFKTCRRKWQLGTLENLEPRHEVTWYYLFGTGVHAGLEAYYLTVGDLMDGDPQENAILAFQDWYEETDEMLLNGDYGARTGELRNELLEYKDLGEGMLYNYHLYVEETGANDFVVCAVEGQWTEEGKKLLLENGLNPPYGVEVHPRLHESGRFLVPIVDPESKKWIEGEPFLSAQLDLVIYRRKTGYRGFWVKDHKTSASKPSDSGIDMDDQVTGYSYTFWRLTGIVPRGTLFNYLIKDLPKEPRLVRDDTQLSSAKDQKTLPSLYRNALEEFGLLVDGKITSTKHAECYESLLAHGWDRFFAPMEVQRNEHELMMFEARLVEEHEDMMAVSLEPERKAYPHLSQYNCPGCSVMSICQAIEDGSDYEDIIRHKFQQAPDRKAK